MTRQQKWSQVALARVQAQQETSEETSYKSLAIKMPVLVRQSGLLQAWAFLRSRDSGPARAFLNDVAKALDSTEEQLFARAQGAKMLEYLALTRDVTEVGIWFRRFAQSELTGEVE